MDRKMCRLLDRNMDRYTNPELLGRLHSYRYLDK